MAWSATRNSGLALRGIGCSPLLPRVTQGMTVSKCEGSASRASQLAPRIIGAAGRESKVVWLASFLAEIWRDNRCLVSERAASYTGIEI
jgi:hypothetical protein